MSVKSVTRGRDIFKDGPSPELEARWSELEDAMQRYRDSDSKQEKEELYQKYPEIRCEVRCCECGQDLGERE